MKKSIITILLSSLLIGCNGQKVSSMPKNIEKGNLEMKIMVATDLHLFSNNLISKNNEIYKKDSITSDGRVQEYDYDKGICYFMEQISSKAVYPMHYWNQPGIIDKFLKEYPQYIHQIQKTETQKGGMNDEI